MGNWTIHDLVAEAAAALAEMPAPANGQVQAVPDERAIRFYAQAGLLAKPSGHRGRTALYDQRHLQQLLTIKQLQREGHTLAEIRVRLQASVPPGMVEAGVIASAAESPAVVGGLAFWRQPPSELRVAGPLASAPAGFVRPGVRVGVRIALGPGVELWLDTPTAPSLDVETLRALARPLLEALAAAPE